MSWTIEVNEDQSVRYVSKFKKGRGSLSALGAAGLVAYVNALSRAEIFACQLAIRTNPFALGHEKATVLACIEAVKGPEYAKILAADASDGELRRAMVLRYCGGFNAPGDTYLRVMYEMKQAGEIK